MKPDMEEPTFVEIDMNAEIGAYQQDDGSRDNEPVADDD
jgi:hypothetical protein